MVEAVVAVEYQTTTVEAQTKPPSVFAEREASVSLTWRIRSSMDLVFAIFITNTKTLNYGTKRFIITRTNNQQSIIGR